MKLTSFAIKEIADTVKDVYSGKNWEQARPAAPAVYITLGGGGGREMR